MGGAIWKKKVLNLYIHKEDVIAYHPEYHGVRLDTLAEKLEDSFVNAIEGKVQSIKLDRSWEERYMLLKETLYRERIEGSLQQLKENIIKLLLHKGTVSDDLRLRIEAEKDIEKLSAWFDTAIDSKSVKDFTDKADL